MQVSSHVSNYFIAYIIVMCKIMYDFLYVL